MSARHAPSGAPTTKAWVVGFGVALIAILVALFSSGAAGAATTTVNAQLSLTGLADANNPLGGSQIGVHPGDSVRFTASTAPTAGLDKLGLGSIGGLPATLSTFQVTADFSGLPGGHANTVLRGSTSVTFHLSTTGTYHFTWTAQSVTALGIIPINLDGNQLAQAGVKLNAKNQYVGAVVVATNPPQGGLSVQLPSVQVAPSAPVVGQLPTVSIPGVQLPTVGVSVPNLAPGGKGASSGSSAKSSATPRPANTYKPPAVLVPDRVVPHGDGGGAYSGSGGGFALDNAAGGAAGNHQGKLVPDLGAVAGSGPSGASGSGNGSGHGSSTPIDLASSPSSPSGQLPVLLAILAVVALAIVAGTYARLYLLGRQGSSRS